MTSPLRQPAIDAVTALADALDRAQTTNAELLVTQGQDRAKIADLEAQLAGQQPPPPPPPPSGTLFGASLSALSGETWAQSIARVEKTLGPIRVWRVYDSANGPTWLFNKLKSSGLLDGKHTIVASVKHIDAGITDLINAVDYITINHEPDQGYDNPGGPRVTPATLATELKDLRSRIDSAGRGGKTKLMLILTGTRYATRVKAYMDAVGSGVVDALGVDPYAASGTATQLVGPLLTAAAQYKLPVSVTEIGMKTATPASTVASFVASMRDLAGKVELVTWFNQPGSAALGNRIDNDPTLAQAFKGLT